MAGSEPGWAPLMFRVGHVLALRDVGEPFTRPPDFDLAGFWGSHVVEFRTSLWRGEAVVRLSPRARDRMAHLASAEVNEAVNRTAGEPDGYGWVTATVPIESEPHAATEFMKLGAEVEVVEPADLRERLVGTARALAALYRVTPAEKLGGPVRLPGRAVIGGERLLPVAAVGGDVRPDVSHLDRDCPRRRRRLVNTPRPSSPNRPDHRRQRQAGRLLAQ